MNCISPIANARGLLLQSVKFGVTWGLGEAWVLKPKLSANCFAGQVLTMAMHVYLWQMS